MELGLTGRVDLSTTMRPLPAMVAYASLLQLPALGLDELVERELAENPALERDDLSSTALEREDRSSTAPPDAGGGYSELADRVDLEDDDLDVLRAEVRLAVRAADQPIVEYVVASLDGRGRFTSTVRNVADDVGVSVERVERVLDVVRAVGPPGVGARDLRECLLLQLDAMGRGRHDPLMAAGDHVLPAGDAITGAGEPVAVTARAVVERYLAELADGRLGDVAEGLGRTVEEVRRAGEFIRCELRPFVAMNVRTWPPRAARARSDLRPDYVFLAAAGSDAGIGVRVAEEELYPLVVSAAYRSAVRTADGPAADQLARARTFLARLQQRWQTMRAVGESIAASQQDFLLARRPGSSTRAEMERARPGALTRAEVARAVGVHESTVSRAVAGRWALLPSGRIMAMADFFGASVAPREAVREVVATETRPLSDAEIARIISSAGHPTARRTVAKYRAQLGIAAQSRR
jgi:RNA polymerase sigma-54 factor